jgi:selenocysteine lyase/cysteine desulfurase
LIIERFREHLRDVKKKSITPERNQGVLPKIVVILESISSTPAILMPWREMVQICKEEGAWSIVDGAHSLGQETDINLSEVDPDFWIGVCPSIDTRYNFL